MSTTKIPTKPAINAERVSRARDMSGLQKWSRDSRFVGFIMLVLGWFTIPAEVFLRRKFGQRWFTPMNYLTGGFLLTAIFLMQYAVDTIHDRIIHFQSSFNPFYSGTAYADYSQTNDLMFWILLYAVMGAYHLFRIWWRKRTYKALHSYDDGISWLEFYGGIIKWLINALAAPFIYLYWRSMPEKERQVTPRPVLINDRTAFVDMVLEPLAFVWLAQYSRSIQCFWIYMTAFSVAIHASWKTTARQNKVLDLQDSALEAKAMRELRQQNANAGVQAKQGTPKTKKASPPARPNVPVHYPDVITIIEQMHQERDLLARVKDLRGG